MLETIKIDNKEITKIAHNRIPVITTQMIAYLHDKEIRRVNEQFIRNKKHFIEKEDFFQVSKFEVADSDFKDLLFPHGSNIDFTIFFTESGYLMLVKTFKDDNAWKIQRVLVNNYFRDKNLEDAVVKSIAEITNKFLDGIKDSINKTVQYSIINNQKQEEIKPVKKKNPRIDYKKYYYEKMQTWLSVKQMQSLLNCSKDTVSRKALRQRWQESGEVRAGHFIKVWRLQSMPQEIQDKYFKEKKDKDLFEN